MDETPFGETRPVARPFYPSSVYSLPDLDALDHVADAKSPGFIYARDQHPNAQTLAAELTRFESGVWGLVAGSGMAAISTAVLSLVQSGDTIVASDQLYGRTQQLFRSELPRLGVECKFVDTNDLDAVRKAMDGRTRVLFVETISNPLLRIADVPELAAIARQFNCRLIVDNTFATPILFRPMEHGADIVMESLTKLISGHADVTLGFLAGNDASLLPRLRLVNTVWGLSGSPFDCWMAERSLATLELRVHAAAHRAEEVARWLKARCEVSRVIWPTLDDHPDRDLAARLLPNGVGHVLTFELPGGRDAVNQFMRKGKSIPFCPSLGHTATTCSHPASTSHRSIDPAERRRMGISDGMIRLSVGIESFETIRDALTQGLQLP